MTCTAGAIRSHSIQNSRILDLLARNGHVKAPASKIDRERGPVISFEDVGRNQATTFSGFCSEHDSAIFKPIEADAFQSTEPEHLFLVAYRAVARELLVLMDAACKIQGTYLKRVDLGIDSGDEPGPAGMTAVDYMLRSYRTYLYKCRFDEGLLAKRYDHVLHDVFTIAHERSTIAVCSLFSLDGLFQNDDWVRVMLNVLPASGNNSTIVFSYLPEDATLVRPALSPILTSAGFYQKYLLSKLILNNCENFVIAPAHFDSWSKEKQEAITNYFCRTLFQGNLDIEDKHLYLF
jgi:hypothetical protein